jgi:hypothetical protein
MLTLPFSSLLHCGLSSLGIHHVFALKSKVSWTGARDQKLSFELPLLRVCIVELVSRQGSFSLLF